jgi:hypothetical protein
VLYRVIGVSCIKFQWKPFPQCWFRCFISFFFFFCICWKVIVTGKKVQSVRVFTLTYTPSGNYMHANCISAKYFFLISKISLKSAEVVFLLNIIWQKEVWDLWVRLVKIFRGCFLLLVVMWHKGESSFQYFVFWVICQCFYAKIKKLPIKALPNEPYTS